MPGAFPAMIASTFSMPLIQFPVLAIITLVLYSAIVALHRLLWHPLSRFQGPRLAAVTDYYYMYFDVVQNGGIIDQLEHLHKRYGPVVRFAPGKLHFSDPKAFDDIYRSSKLTKEAWFYDAFLEKESSFGFIDPVKARERKEVLRPLFSRIGVLKLENVIQDAVDRLVTVLASHDFAPGPPKSLNIFQGYQSISLEVIMTYCFAKSYNCIEYPDFSHPVLLAMQSWGIMFFAIQHFPWLGAVIFGMPHWLSKVVSTESTAMQDSIEILLNQIDEILADPTSLDRADHEIVYHHLISRSGKGGKTPSRQSLLDEAGVLVGAGSETVGNTCTIGTFHLLNNKSTLQRLKAELHKAWPEVDSPMNLEKLENLPYLTAVIKESLRMSHGVVSPLPRVVHGDMTIGGVVVPSGTVVAMGQTFVHYNPDLFPDPKHFNPDRWLSGDVRELENSLVPFSKGPRMCLGYNMAWAELYLLFANIFRKLDLTLDGNIADDFTFSAFLTPKYRGKPLSVFAKAAHT